MRKFMQFGLPAALLLGFIGISQATPLSASGALAASAEQAMADQGATQVRWRGRVRHSGWNRGHHYGWAPRRHHHRRMMYYR
jgi:hypothetical protein